MTSDQFKKLSKFILKEMRMSHIYQPAMLIELLKNKGRASTEDIAKALVGYDKSQVEYYEHITKNMVGKYLRIVEESLRRRRMSIQSLVSMISVQVRCQNSSLTVKVELRNI